MLPDQAVEHLSSAHIETLAEQTWALTDTTNRSVEILAEQVLGYDLEITGDGIFQDPNILGGISFEQNTIYVNASVEAHEGRYNFTLAHEIGHHVLHKDLYLALYAGQDGIMCREQAHKPLVERQADRFAAALLMPASVMRAASDDKVKPKHVTQAVELAREVQDSAGLEHVSLSAVVNRLIDLGLVANSVPYQSGRFRFSSQHQKRHYPAWARTLYRLYKRLRTRR